MHGYLIDPDTGTISTIEISKMSTLDDLHKRIDCETVDILPEIIPGHDLWLDDEGLIHDTLPHGLFAINHGDCTAILAGRAVLLGNDGQGNCTDATCTADDISEIVRQVTLIDNEKKRIDTTNFRIA